MIIYCSNCSEGGKLDFLSVEFRKKTLIIHTICKECDAEEVYFLDQSSIDKYDGLPIAITKEWKKKGIQKK